RRDALEVRGLPIARQMFPDFVADAACGVDRRNPEHAHAAQDERHHRRRQRVAAGESAARDIAERMDYARQAREHVAADVVDRAGPARGFEWTLAPMQIVARDALRRAERDQIVEMFRLAADRVRLETGAREDVERERTDAAARTGDHDRAHVRT